MCKKKEQSRYSRLSDTAVVVWAFKGEASESSLYVKAALILRTRVCSCQTFINICQKKKKTTTKTQIIKILLDH